MLTINRRIASRFAIILSFLLMIFFFQNFTNITGKFYDNSDDTFFRLQQATLETLLVQGKSVPNGFEGRIGYNLDLSLRHRGGIIVGIVGSMTLVSGDFTAAVPFYISSELRILCPRASGDEITTNYDPSKQVIKFDCDYTNAYGSSYDLQRPQLAIATPFYRYLDLGMTFPIMGKLVEVNAVNASGDKVVMTCANSRLKVKIGGMQFQCQDWPQILTIPNYKASTFNYGEGRFEVIVAPDLVVKRVTGGSFYSSDDAFLPAIEVTRIIKNPPRSSLEQPGWIGTDDRFYNFSDLFSPPVPEGSVITEVTLAPIDIGWFSSIGIYPKRYVKGVGLYSGGRAAFTTIDQKLIVVRYGFAGGSYLSEPAIVIDSDVAPYSLLDTDYDSLNQTQAALYLKNNGQLMRLNSDLTVTQVGSLGLPLPPNVTITKTLQNNGILKGISQGYNITACGLSDVGVVSCSGLISYAALATPSTVTISNVVTSMTPIVVASDVLTVKGGSSYFVFIRKDFSSVRLRWAYTPPFSTARYYDLRISTVGSSDYNNIGASQKDTYLMYQRPMQYVSGGTPVQTAQVVTAAACSFNGATIESGLNVTAYLANSVPAGSTCTSQLRNCSNGILSGSYTYSSCTVQAAASQSCTFNGATIQSGSSVTAYLANSVPSGSTCTSQSRTCSNGTLSGSYTYSACTVAAAPSGGSVTLSDGTVARSIGPIDSVYREYRNLNQCN